MKTNFITNSIYTLLIIISLFHHQGNAQVLDANNEFTIILSDNSKVIVYKKASSFDEISDEYYSLPSHLKFSTNKNKEPEFSMIKYGDNDGDQGGILHFLTSWGLSLSQRNEVQKELEKIEGEQARFMGAVIPEIDADFSYLQITGKSPLKEILNSSATSIGRVPTYPNAKSASSFKLSSEDAQTLEKTIQSNKKDLKTLFLTMNFIIRFKGKFKTGLSNEPYQIQENLHTLLNQ